MTRAELEQKFRCGPIEKSYENATAYILFVQAVFFVVAIYFIWLMLREPLWVQRIDNIAVMAFCLWRIHRQHDVMCYVAKKGIIVRRQYTSFADFRAEQKDHSHNMVFLSYDVIFSIADNWREIELGQATEGGLAVLPVRLQFLSKKHKQDIIDRIKEEQEKEDKDE